MSQTKRSSKKRVTKADLAAVKSSPGKPLPPVIKKSLESRFQTDLSNVRVHDSPAAVRILDKVGSKAFANGNNIFLSSGMYNTREGQQLLAHELAHVIQQRQK